MFERLKSIGIKIKGYIHGVYNYIREELVPCVVNKLQKEIMICNDCNSTYITIWHEGVWKENYNKGIIEETTPTRGEMSCGDCGESDIYEKDVWRWSRA